MEERNNTQKLVRYFKKNLAKGYTIESLKWALIKQGYSRILIDRAVRQTNIELAKKAPVIKEKPIIKYQIIDENNQPIVIKKPFWKKIFKS